MHFPKDGLAWMRLSFNDLYLYILLQPEKYTGQAEQSGDFHD